jgi:hypothetical protein
MIFVAMGMRELIDIKQGKSEEDRSRGGDRAAI